MGQTILVTGASGFIGRRLVQRLAEGGTRVLAAYRRTLPDASPPGVEAWQVDLTAPETLEPLPSPIDGVVHLAAATSVLNNMVAAERALAVNGMGTFNLLRFCVERRIPSFVFGSSLMVYGKVRSRDPIPESWPLAPINFYGTSRLVMERYAELIGQTFGLRTVGLRVSSVYGPGQHAHTVLAVFVRRALAGQDLEVFGRGEKVQDFLHVEDAVRGITCALQSSASGVFNIASGVGTPVTELAQRVSAIFSGGRARVVSRPDLPEDGNMIRLDITRARESLGYVPQYDLEAGLRAYYRELTGGPGG